MNPKIVDEESELVCPICGIDYNHVRSVAHDPDGGKDLGLSEIKIEFDCENGHSWMMRLYEAKGRVQFSREKMDNSDNPWREVTIQRR